MWRYKVLNDEVLGEDHHMSVCEDNMIKPDYEIGEEYQSRDNIGEIAKGKVKDVRVVEGKVEYEVSITYKPKTFTAVSAEAMSRDFLP